MKDNIDVADAIVNLAVSLGMIEDDDDVRSDFYEHVGMYEVDIVRDQVDAFTG